MINIENKQASLVSRNTRKRLEAAYPEISQADP